MENKQKLFQEKLEELLDRPKICFDDDLRNNLPNSSGIYRIYKKDSINNETIYLGKSKDVRRRLNNNHYRGGTGNSTLRRKLSSNLSNEEITSFLNQECNIQFLEIEEKYLSCLEHYLIAILCPKYNN